MDHMLLESTKKLLFAAALGAAVSACATDTPDVGITDEEIIGGFPVRSKTLDGVGALGFDQGDGTYFPFCSATLIKPDLVLTAEHCVNFINDPAQVHFLIGWDGNHPKRTVPLVGVAWEDTVHGGLVGLGSDVAVVHLAETVTDVTPLRYAALEDSQIGRRFVAIGYGQQDALGTAGTRMAGSMTFNAHGGKLYELIYGSFEAFLEEGKGVFFPPWTDTTDPDTVAGLQEMYDSERLLDGLEGFFGNGVGDAQACFGDSGGPMTAQQAGKTTVFGVASWVPFADDLCRYGSTYASLNPISLDFIDYELKCPLIPREGTCDGDTVVRCATHEEGGYRELRTDCSELGLICAIDEAGELGCTDDPCEGIPAEGTCDGSVAIRCSTPEEGPRRVVTTDCAELGLACGVEAGAVTCVDDGIPNCDHEICDVGTSLDPSCGSCQADICAVDSYCCDVFWDEICVDEVGSVCGQSCPDAAAPTALDYAKRATR